MPKNIFFIGPASVGKSTVASELAKELGYTFIDIDNEFCKRIALIPDVIESEGYQAYCEKNSALVDMLIEENNTRTVFATPAGYLVHEDSPHLVEKHLQVIKTGISILLLPDNNPETSVTTVVRRQLDRWPTLKEEKERQRFLSRFEKYKNYGDIKIFSMEPPANIVRVILEKLQEVL